MQLETIKKQVEDNKSFQYWNKAIGLSFDDFDILELVENDTKFLKHKEGKKDIGNYYICLKNGVINGAFFDLDNETVRQDNLKRIGYDKKVS
jgi:hypothetical protein